MSRSFEFLLCSIVLVLLSSSCSKNIEYEKIPVSDRRMNLSGLVAVSTTYLNENPEDFYKFHRILVAADEALGARSFITRAGVMRWLERTAEREGYGKTMPVYLFLKAVYLEGWEHAYLNRVDLSEREYLYDLISSVMGGMHLCHTCSTSPEPP